ncbi:MAG TPA: hypothetical protein DDW52_21610, partial [Planctomycetaceae bacterium]|nr:hypothetical protein [Planctomycetaceae bacterium]
MGLYCAVLTPVFEPIGRPPHELPEPPSAVASTQEWDEFFPPDAWQRQDPSRVQTRRGMMLAKEWTQTSPKTFQFKPLTIIIPISNDDPSDDTQSVWILTAKEGATLQFAKNFDARSEPVPPIESGKLSGDIDITRKTLGEQTDEPMQVRTSEVFIEQNRIYTEQQVRITSGKSVILGQGLRIDLLGDIFTASTSAGNRWGPLDRLEVYRIEKVGLELEPGGLWRGMSDSLTSHSIPLDTLPARLELATNGRFTYDFRRNTAKLNNGVQIYHYLGDTFRDEFSCQELTAAFRDTPAQTPPKLPESLVDTSDESNSAKRVGFGDLELIEVEAIGADKVVNFFGEKKVELNAPAIDAYATAKHLTLNFPDQHVVFSGKLPTPGAARSTARVRYGPYEFIAPLIDYDANGDAPGSVEHLGFLVASGPGELNLSPEHELGATQVRWKNEFHVKPTDDPQQQLVGILGNTLVESRKYGFLTCEQLQVWLNKLTPGNSSQQVQLGGVPASNSSSSDFATNSYRPHHIVAKDRVNLTGETLAATVDSLQLALVFVDPPAPGEEAGELALRNSSGDGKYQWLGPPSTAPQGRSVAGQASGGASVPITGQRVGPGVLSSSSNQVGVTLRQPTARVTGKTLKTRLIIAEKETWVDDLQLAGPLTLESVGNSDSQTSWKTEGDRLSLVTSPAGDVNLQVTGQPARVYVGSGMVEGETIHFDQQTNLVWMDAPGSFSLLDGGRTRTTNAAQFPDNADSPLAAARQLEWIGEPTCTWQGGMYLDGQVVNVKDSVEFNGKLRGNDGLWWSIHASSDWLRIVLDSEIDMGQPTGQEVSVERIEMVDNVIVDAIQLDSAGNKLNYERILVPKLRMMTATNQVIGDGPGDIFSWNVTKSEGKETGRALSMGNTQTGLSGSHLMFRDSFVAFLDRDEVVFEGKVQVAHGPLQSMQQAIDLTRMRSLKMGQSTIEADQIRVYDTSRLRSTASLPTHQPGDSAWNFQAIGNVAFEGIVQTGQYKGTASEIKYVEAKRHLIVNGDARRNATIERTAHGEVNPNVFSSLQKAVIDTDTLEVEVIEFGDGGASFGQLKRNP